MNEDRDVVLFRIDRKTGLLMLGVLAVVLGGAALSEQLTLTTSYPVPSGIYNQLITTGNSGSTPADTTLNRNAGNVILVPPTNAGGNVGIGTGAPASKLSVAGGIQLGDDTSACTPAKVGVLSWHAGNLQTCRGGMWAPLVGAPSLSVYWDSNTNLFSYKFIKGAGSIGVVPSSAWVDTCTYGIIGCTGWNNNTAYCPFPPGAVNPHICAASITQDGVAYSW